MKNKTKKIIAVVVAVLFSLTIIGGIIISIIAPKNDTVTASADTYNEGISLYSNTSTPTTSTLSFVGCYYFTIPTGASLSAFTYSVSSYGFLVGPYLCSSLDLSIVNGSPVITCTLYVRGSFQSVVIYNNGFWASSDYRYWCFYYRFTGAIAAFINTYSVPCLNSAVYSKFYDEAYDDGYDSGYNEGYDLGFEDGLPQGYDQGYEDGFSEGYDVSYELGVSKGHSDQITNPIIAFIEPVHKFMNTKFFGSLTYAAVFNTVLFVVVAVIFIKMFGGG